MSTTVDKKVVEMQFNNSNFEKNVSQSMSTLDKLKAKLNFGNSSKSLESLQDSSNKVNFSGMAGAIENVVGKFKMMDVVAVTALANITNSAVEAGKNLVKSLSVDQITSGFDKYTQKTSSVQTIMNSTGKSIDEVNEYLDKLMWYSDETSYGFTDMTQSLASLTSAGGNIDKLIPMIEGVANATAFAGKGAAEFSRVIYNLNQSYGSGSLKLMDWKSVEMAGVASKQLKEVLISTGEELGKISKGKVTLGNFNDSLKDDWADTSVMEAAFSKFSEITEKAYEMVESGEYDTASEAIEELSKKYEGIGIESFKAAQEAKTFTEAIDATKDAVSSGWLKTFEIIFGNYEEAKKVWTGLTNWLWDIFASGSEKRNGILEDALYGLNGREELLSAFSNVGDTILKYINIFKKSFSKLFGIDSYKIYDWIHAFEAFTEKIKLSEENVSNFTIFLETRVSKFKVMIENVKNILKNFYDIGKSILTSIKKSLYDVFDIKFENFENGIIYFLNKINLVTDALKKSFESSDNLYKIFRNIFSIAKKLGDVIGNVLFKIFDGLTDYFIDVGEKGFTFSAIIEALTRNISNFVDKMLNGLNNLFSIFNKIVAVFKKVFSTISGIAKSIFQKIKDNFSFDKLFSGLTDSADEAGFVLMSVGFFNLLKMLTDFIKSLKEKTSQISETFSKVKDVLSSLKDTLVEYQSSIKAGTILKIALAVGILALSVIKLSTIDTEQMLSSLVGLELIFLELASSFKMIQKIASSGTGKTSGLIAMALSVLILASALKKISQLNLEQVGIGLLGMAGIMGEIIIFSKLMSKIPLSSAFAILIIAPALVILAGALKILGSMSLEQIGLGLLALGGSLLILSGAMYLMKKSIAGAFAMLIIAPALIVLAGALKIFGSMSLEQIGLGLLALGGSLLILSGAMFLMKKSIAGAFAMLIIAPALMVLSGVLKILGSMSLEQIGLGLLAFGGSLLILSGAMFLMKKSIAGAFALLIIAPALIVLAGALKVLGSMSLGNVVVGLIALAGVLAILAIAANVMTPIIPEIIALSIALALVGVASLAISAGIMLLSLAIVTLCSVISKLPELIEVLVVNFVKFLPDVIAALVNGIATFIKSLADSIDVIVESVVKIGIAILDGLLQLIPKVIEVAFSLLIAFLTTLAENIQQIVELGIEIVTKLLIGIANKLPDLIEAAFELIISFVNGLSDAIRNNALAIRNAAKNLITSLFDALLTFILGEDGPAKFKELATNIIDGIKNGITSCISKIKDIAKSIGDALLNGVKNVLGIHSPSKEMGKLGKFSGLGFINELSKFLKISRDTAEDIGNETKNGLKRSLSDISKVIDLDIDYQPTIRPVVDLSNVNKSTKYINDSMSDLNGYYLKTAYDAKMSIDYKNNLNNINSSELKKINELLSENQNEPQEINNTFYITGDDPKEIAEDVAKIIQRQVERKQATWG